MSSEVNPFEPPKAGLDVPLAAEAGPALWNPDAAGAWSLLLTPIFGSVLVRKNWQAIGDEAKARTGTICGRRPNTFASAGDATIRARVGVHRCSSESFAMP